MIVLLVILAARKVKLLFFFVGYKLYRMILIVLYTRCNPVILPELRQFANTRPGTIPVIFRTAIIPLNSPNVLGSKLPLFSYGRDGHQPYSRVL